ncbi:uncharacterized protein [Centruroides vittatus]|uniref:uncharacterized protein n=1 Tax=Centruroides vittatus TaxID=120091 RepID=UPI003510785C
MRIGKSSIASIVKEVCEALWSSFQSKYMPIPTKEHMTEKAEQFYKKWNFPNCVGSIDEKHLRINCPPNSGSQYYNYKQFFSIVLQAVVDADLKFLTIDVGAYGRQSDGGVFKYSVLYQNLESNKLELPSDTTLPHSNTKAPYVLIGNEVYPLTPYLLKPYSRRSLDKSETIFNYRLSRARRVVECAFGICAVKWRILNKFIETSVENAINIVKAVTLLHNVIIDIEGCRESHAIETDLSKSKCKNLTKVNNAASFSAKVIRDKFCQYFNSLNGSVPWQEQAVNRI